MRITFIVASLGDGGAERVVSELAGEMHRQGHRVSVVTIGSSNRSYRIPEEITVIDCARKYPIPGMGFLLRVMNIRNAIKTLDSEVCISFNTTVNIYAILACSGLPCKLVLSERNDPRYYPSGKFQRALRTLLYPKADRFVFQTQEAKSWFRENIQMRGTVIYNPIHPGLPAVYAGQRSKRVVTAVRLEPQKNLTMAIDAFEKLHREYPEYVFEIYGKGTLQQSLTEYISRKNLQDCVILKGNSTTLYADILDAALFVLSSDFEGMSNSMLEAIALGIPTISTDYPSGGARAVIKDGVNGLLVPVGDTEGMYCAMQRVLGNPALAADLSRNGEKLREQLSVTQITNEWLNFIS